MASNYSRKSKLLLLAIPIIILASYMGRNIMQKREKNSVEHVIESVKCPDFESDHKELSSFRLVDRKHRGRSRLGRFIGGARSSFWDGTTLRCTALFKREDAQPFEAVLWAPKNYWRFLKPGATLRLEIERQSVGIDLGGVNLNFVGDVQPYAYMP